MKRGRGNPLMVKGNQLARGVHDRGWDGKRRETKAYTEAVRELLACPVGDVPPSWPTNRKEWTSAQELAERHMALARSGDLDTAEFIISRAEGKVPSAPEDREASEVAARVAGQQTMTGVAALMLALGMKPMKVIDTTVEEE